MFTMADICNITVQIEKNGEKTYRSAGACCPDPAIAATLIWMADQEHRHALWFEGLRSNRQLSAEEMKMEAVGKTLLQDMVRDNEFLLNQSELERAVSVSEVLTRSKAFEQDTIVFYTFLLDFAHNDETRLLLQKIIAEERNHIRELERLATGIGHGWPQD